MKHHRKVELWLVYVHYKINPPSPFLSLSCFSHSEANVHARHSQRLPRHVGVQERGRIQAHSKHHSGYSSSELFYYICDKLRLHYTDHILLTDLKPKGVVVNMIPGLPAYILFMCVRHADYLNDEVKLKSLMNVIICAVKKVIMVRLILFLVAFISTVDLLNK